MNADDAQDPDEIRRALEGFLDRLAKEVVRGLDSTRTEATDAERPTTGPRETGETPGPKLPRPSRRRRGSMRPIRSSAILGSALGPPRRSSNHVPRTPRSACSSRATLRGPTGTSSGAVLGDASEPLETPVRHHAPRQS